MTDSFFPEVSDKLIDLQRERKIRLDQFTYDSSNEGWKMVIHIEIYKTGELVRRIFIGKLKDGVQDQAMAILNQIQ